ncbi:O-antigen ligase family protein [Endozoicomonas numazuensis]|uniref:O-antigen ligase-related domain-containing protein n=1 Tax=Endozoicomonas numazuensis TaxID=1137799 RepID=A0A081NJ78_9GAMM|nr:O-antigen ligase family protein [Endozoicomonas numazuensis]KEQ18501.1 hypothetical protein GZ78_13540 [Endozoicomonas numazuensis]
MIAVNRSELKEFAFAFIIVFSLMFNSMFGVLAGLVFLAAGILVVILDYGQSLAFCRRHWVILLIPVMSMLSFLWSDQPGKSLRSGFQLFLTSIIAIVLAETIKDDTFLSAAASAMLIAMLMSLFFGRTAINGLTQDVVLTGIYQSKNFLSVHSGLSIFTGLTLMFSRRHRLVFRGLGALLMLTSFVVLIYAKSLGGLVAVIMSVVAGLVVILYLNWNMRSFSRRAMNFFLILAAVCIGIAIVIFVSQGYFDELMYSLNKDPTLTGRTYIWQRGLEFFWSNPIFGTGFQAVFYQGNNVAEDIWEALNFASGAKFNFHNMFVDILIELGAVGFTIFLSVILIQCRRILLRRSIALGSRESYAVFIFIFMLSQTILEVSWFREFSMMQLLICFSWVYLSPHSEIKPIRVVY